MGEGLIRGCAGTAGCAGAVGEWCWLGATAVRGIRSLNSAVAQLQRKMEERRLRLQEAANR